MNDALGLKKKSAENKKHPDECNRLGVEREVHDSTGHFRMEKKRAAVSTTTATISGMPYIPV